MTSDRKPKGPGEGRVSGKEMADALADVIKDQSEKAQAREAAAARTRRTSGPVTWVLFVVCSVFSAYLWIGSPQWLKPDPPGPVPAPLADAGLRMEVYNQAVLVEDFLEREGRLPNSLQEAGDPFSDVSYQRLDERTYLLALETESGAVRYESGRPLEAFLGDALQVIREGG